MKPENWTENSQKVLFDSLKSLKVLLRQECQSRQAKRNNSNITPNAVTHNGTHLNSIKGQLTVSNAISSGLGIEAFLENFASATNENSSSKFNGESKLSETALDTLCQTFGLDRFERQTLLLTVGAEIMPSFGTIIGEIEDSKEAKYPTFNLAIKLFSRDTNFRHFSLSPNAPLRDWELIRFKSSNEGRHFKSLEVDEKILDYLLGYSVLDRRLENVIRPVSSNNFPLNTESLQEIASSIVQVIDSAIKKGESIPLIQLCGNSIDLKRQILATTLESMECSVCELPWVLMPQTKEELDELCLLWTREAILDDRVLLLDCQDIGKNDAEHLKLLNKFLTIMDVPIIVCTDSRLPLSNHYGIILEIPTLSPAEQHGLWQTSLRGYADSIPEQVETIVANFQLSPQEIFSTARSSIATAKSYEDLSKKLWSTCRVRARPKLDELAERIEPSAGWSDLILPNERKKMLREMIATVRHRTTVFQRWNFGKKNNRGLGLCALFAGTSGTGKTMAAEVLAHELNLDLYRIDLSTVVSKYIGETEKNLGKLFDAAESGGVILLFDEGDALFGKRTEASDSKDRYANMEVSYLLQKIESYSGLAIITTNIEDSLDSAFMRRLRYVIKFPFPGAEQRARIWQRVYPEGVLRENDSQVYLMLGQMEISGGLIYSIALKSAFLAADEGVDGVYFRHIEQAAKSEYTKIGRTLSMSETPWVMSQKRFQ